MTLLRPSSSVTWPLAFYQESVVLAYLGSHGRANTHRVIWCDRNDQWAIAPRPDKTIHEGKVGRYECPLYLP